MVLEFEKPEGTKSSLSAKTLQPATSNAKPFGIYLIEKSLEVTFDQLMHSLP